MIRDEQKGMKEYMKYGLKNLAGDERRHRNFLRKMCNKKGKMVRKRKRR